MDMDVPKAIATKQVTISSAAVLLTALPVDPFTAAQVLQAARAVITVRTSAINIRWDGTSPTVAIGHKFEAGDVFQIQGNFNISQLELIRDGGTDSVVTITLEG
jgi:hypothetical protein